MAHTKEETHAANRAELHPGDLDLAVNVLTKLLDENNGFATIATHTRVRKGVITRIEFSFTNRTNREILDLVELNDNTALAWVYAKIHSFHPNTDMCNQTDSGSHCLELLEVFSATPASAASKPSSPTDS